MAVAEGFCCPPCDHRADAGGGVSAHLFGGRRDAGDKFCLFPLHRRRIADHEDARVVADIEMCVNGDAACAVTFDAEPFCGGRGHDACGPDQRAGGDEGLTQSHALAGAIGCGLACQHFNAHARQRFMRKARQRFGKGRQ